MRRKLIQNTISRLSGNSGALTVVTTRPPNTQLHRSSSSKRTLKARDYIEPVPYDSKTDMEYLTKRIKEGGFVIASFPLITCEKDREQIEKTMGTVEKHWDKYAHTTCIFWDDSISAVNASTILGVRFKGNNQRSALTVSVQQPYKRFALRDVMVATKPKFYERFRPDINIISFSDSERQLILSEIERRTKISQNANESNDSSLVPRYFSASTKLPKGETNVENCQSYLFRLFDTIGTISPFDIFPEKTLRSDIFRVIHQASEKCAER